MVMILGAVLFVQSESDFSFERGINASKTLVKTSVKSVPNLNSTCSVLQFSAPKTTVESDKVRGLN
ncbi:hypothetical protein V6Z12_A11G263900 [Gossypium hirsutum]